MDIEHGTFTPLVFSGNGSMGPEAELFHKNMASKMSEKTGECYPGITNYMQCKISFIILHATVLYLRGSRVKPQLLERVKGDDFSLYTAGKPVL